MNILPLNELHKELNRPFVIAGPCSAETEEQVTETCERLAVSDKINVLRAGIWKPRTRPNSFEGIGEVGLEWLQKVKKQTGLLTTVEVATPEHVQLALKYDVDILWIGARTTVNPFSVQAIADELKGVQKAVMIKNPINTDLNLWIGAIERIYNAGIQHIGAIHRGFSEYGQSIYRNNPKWQIPIELKSRIPSITMVCDPSHICGNRELIESVSQEALDLNFDGLMIESHIDPDNAWSDAKQQVTPETLHEIIKRIVLRDETIDKESPLTKMRKEIDTIDNQILQLLADRMNVADEIGKFKKENNITILQPARWQEIVERNIVKGDKMGLSAEFIEKMTKSIHQESINHQNQIMNA